MENNWFWMMLILPCILAFFKNELSDLLLDWKIYKYRRFNTDDKVDILNLNTGNWGTITIIDYTMGLSTEDRTVEFKHKDGRIERVPFKVWNKIRKAPSIEVKKI